MVKRLVKQPVLPIVLQEFLTGNHRFPYNYQISQLVEYQGKPFGIPTGYQRETFRDTNRIPTEYR